MKRFAYYAVFSLILAWTGVAAAAGGPKIEAEEDVVGKIRVLCDIAGVTVELAGFSFQTKAGKAIVIGNVPVGAHEVVATKKGYQTWRSPVTVTPDATVRVNIKMWAATGDEAQAADSDREAVEQVIKAKQDLAKEKEQASGQTVPKIEGGSGPVPAQTEEKPEPGQTKEADKPAPDQSAPAKEEAKPAVEETPVAAKKPEKAPEAAPAGKDGEGEENSVASLLASAEEDMKALRLTTPATNNALDKFKTVLMADPGNAEARKGLNRIVEIYLRLARRADGKGEKKKAERLLVKAAKANPDDPRIAALREEVRSDKVAARKEPAKVNKVRKAPALPKTWTNSIGMKFILCPAGTFLLGSASGVGYADERPQRTVTFKKPFYIGAFEVTQLDYQRVVGENPAKFRETASDFQAKLQRPVERVDWNQANRFCAMLGALEGDKVYRLPTETEWEYACRAGGDRLGPIGVKGSQTKPIGKSQPNPWGIYDMQGNVFEWCSDYYSADAYAKDTDVDPQGPEKGRDRVARGGSYMSDHTDDGSTGSNQRSHFPPHFRKEFIGFRVVRVP